MVSRATITSMTWMILRTIPPIALSASRAPEGDAGHSVAGLRRRGQAPWLPGSKFTLSSPFAPTAGFRCAKG
jgi:hypothetical protein